MTHNIQCLSNLDIPRGILGILSETDLNSVTAFPAIKHKIYVSFNINDCKKMNMNVLGEGQLDEIIAKIEPSSFSSLSTTSGNLMGYTQKLSLDDKRSLVSQKGNKFTLNGYVDPLNLQYVEYFKNLFQTLNCLTNLEFEVINENLYNKNPSEYKISICGIKNNAMKLNFKQVGHAYISFGKNPTQCFIAIDNIDNSADHNELQYYHNTLGHELLHCLGLNHPNYKTLKENQDHRSILEDRTPITEECLAKRSSSKDLKKCINAPAMPTGDDICALNKLYGTSINETSVCYEMAQKFVTQYSNILALETAGSNDNYNDEF